MQDKKEKSNMSDFISNFVDSELDNIEETYMHSSKEETSSLREEYVEPEQFENLEDLDSLDTGITDIENKADWGDEYNEELEDGLTPFQREILEWQPEEPEYRVGFVRNTFALDGWIGNLHLDRILTDAVLIGASDVHITAEQTISFTKNGDIIRCDEYEVPTQEILHKLVHEGLLSFQDQQIFNRDLDFNGSYTIHHGPYAKYFKQRTRVNIARSLGKYSIVFRIINDTIPPLSALEIEDEIVSWAEYPNGLFLLCGPTGTGKTTTLASVIRNVQQTTRKKIITIENPIEYIYPDDSDSLVVQSEVGIDTKGFYEGLTSAMRQNPDIILLGEVRNTEEVQELLRAAETGHLAISTMHTNSVATTINRIQNLFTGEDQKRIMSTLSDSLRGIGNQVLVKDKNDGRFAVRELLTVNKEIKELILKGDVEGIRAYQKKHKKTLEHGLVRAVKSGRCFKSEAIKHTADPVLFNEIFDEY